MNGIEFINDCEMKKICRTCLKTNIDLYPMSFDIKNLYETLVGKIENEEYNMVCVICYWLFRKIFKFKQQCQSANNIMREIIYMDKSLNFIPNYDLNYTIKTDTHYLGPVDTDKQNDLSDMIEIEINTFDDNSSNEMVDEIKNETHIDDIDNDDDLPLMMFKKQKRKRKNKIKESIKKKKKEKKQLKEGFTSRMIQETDEYIVIKLSRDQVLNEMKQRSESETYTRYPYKCEKCVKGFNFLDVLYSHMEKHRQETGSFECDMCYQYCPSAVSLRGHIKSHTTRYKCKVCGHIRLSRQHLLEHYGNTHGNQPITYKCDSCEFTTNKRTVMQRHVKSHDMSSRHACHKCGKLFKTLDSLRVHTMRHDKSSLYSCSQCTASFVYLSLLHKHVAHAHSSRDLYCVECDTRFKSYESLRLHFKKAKRHRDPSTLTHPCPQCPRLLPSPSAVSSHVWASHSPARCALCSRRYTNRDALRAHVWRTHRGACATCGGTTNKTTNKNTKHICSCSETNGEINDKIEILQSDDKIVPALS